MVRRLRDDDPAEDRHDQDTHPDQRCHYCTKHKPYGISRKVQVELRNRILRLGNLPSAQERMGN